MLLKNRNLTGVFEISPKVKNFVQYYGVQYIQIRVEIKYLYLVLYQVQWYKKADIGPPPLNSVKSTELRVVF